MRTKTPQQIYEQTDRILKSISAQGRTLVMRLRWMRIVNAYTRYVDNIYALHTDNYNGLSVEESNHIWYNAATPVINYKNR